MDYISTRDTSEVPRSISSAQAIKTGIAPDGGLFMPTEIPHLAPGDIEKLCAMPYSERAAYILSMFLTDYDRDGLRADAPRHIRKKDFPLLPRPSYPSARGSTLLSFGTVPPVHSRTWRFRSCRAFSPAHSP